MHPEMHEAGMVASCSAKVLPRSWRIHSFPWNLKLWLSIPGYLKPNRTISWNLVWNFWNPLIQGTESGTSQVCFCSKEVCNTWGSTDYEAENASSELSLQIPCWQPAWFLNSASSRVNSFCWPSCAVVSNGVLIVAIVAWMWYGKGSWSQIGWWRTSQSTWTRHGTGTLDVAFTNWTRQNNSVHLLVAPFGWRLPHRWVWASYV